jgi:chemotaxis signal transduction protein
VSEEGRAAELRRAFDEAFARPHPERASGLEDLVIIRTGGHPHALRVSELRGLHRAGRVVPLPSPLPDLLGLAGIRGRLVPVFSLPLLLGYGAQRDAVRWVALCDGGEPMALGFEELDGHRRVGPDQICAAAEGAGRAHLPQVVRLAEGGAPLISVASMVNLLRARADRPGTRSQ